MKKLLLLLSFLSAPVLSAQKTISIQTLEACSLIENNSKRLYCYDKTVKNRQNSHYSNTQAVSPIRGTISSNAEPIRGTITPINEFGLEHKDVTKGKAAKIKADVALVKTAHYGELVITLNNNQQWRQIGTDRMRLKKGDTVIISRGALSSFLLKKEGSNRSIRVKRTK